MLDPSLSARPMTSERPSPLKSPITIVSHVVIVENVPQREVTNDVLPVATLETLGVALLHRCRHVSVAGRSDRPP